MKVIRTKHPVPVLDPLPSLIDGEFEVIVERGEGVEYLVELPNGEKDWIHGGDCEVIRED